MTVLETMRGYSGRIFVDGAYRESGGGRLDVIDPATEERIGEAAVCTEAEVNEAIRIANDAQKKWARQNFLYRSELMHEVAHDIVIYPGARHSFFNDRGPNYDRDAARDAWRRTLSFFAEHLA